MNPINPRLALIALTGRIACGKDTAAQLLIQNGYTAMRFADPLKEAIAAMLSVPRELLEDRAWKERVLDDVGQTPRFMMQTIGTEWGRHMIHPNIWVRLLKRRVLEHGGPIVIPDCRFDNEARMVRELGGAVVEIIRPEHGTFIKDGHKSEAGVDPNLVDAIIYNDSTLEAFRSKTRLIFDAVLDQDGHAPLRQQELSL